MSAIITRFEHPRVVAVGDTGCASVEYDDSLNLEANHAAALKALCEQLGLHGRWVGAANPDGAGIVWVRDLPCGYETET